MEKKWAVYGQNIGEPRELLKICDSELEAQLSCDSFNETGGKLFDGSYARNKFKDKNYA